MPGERITRFLDCEARKQHHTLAQILMGLRHSGFVLKAVEEAEPSAKMLGIPGMRDELGRPTSGTVTVDGRDIFAPKDETLTIFRRRKICGLLLISL